MKRPVAIALLLLGSALVVAVSVPGSKRGDKGELVYVEAVKRGELRRDVSASGRLTPKESVQLSAEVLGTVLEVTVEAGDRVEAGQLLVRIDRGTLQEQIDRSDAQVRLDRIAIDGAGLRRTKAKRDLTRVEELHARGILSDAALEDARLAAEQARVDAEATRERLRQSEASLRSLKTDVAKTEVVAPLSATVLAVSRRPGEGVAPGMGGSPGSSLMVLGDLSQIFVEIEIEEAEVAVVAVGQEASVEVDALADRTFEAVVEEVAVQGRTGSRGAVVFDAKLRLLDPDPALRTGMSARADVHVERIDGALMLPLAAIVEDDGDEDGDEGGDGDEADRDSNASRGKPIELVFVVEGGVVRRTVVETGESNDTEIVVLSGVDEGDRVVVGPARTLRKLDDGDAVKPESEDGDEDGHGDEDEDRDEPAGRTSDDDDSAPASKG